MKTYFACSDIHGFFDEFTRDLFQAGFDLNNPEHILIVCGDIFDRGRKPLELYHFLRSIPRERRFMIIGNHELLLQQLVERQYPLDYDITNGTYNTLLDLNSEFREAYENWLIENPRDNSFIGNMEWRIKEAKFLESNINSIYENPNIAEILAWIKSDEWQYYLKLGKYIFVHSFIPKETIFDTRWKEASEEEWKEATWVNPWKHYQQGFFKLEEKEGYTLVCGHWHTSDFYNNLLYRYEPEKRLEIRKSNPIFKSDLCPGLMGLDTCTVLTGKVNILVLQENELRFE